MDQGLGNFEIDYKGGKINVVQHSISGQVLYRIVFPDKSHPLVLTRATSANEARWWTSIPEGRQREAEEIGPLIAEYIKSKQ